MKKKVYLYYNDGKEIAQELYEKSLPFFQERGIEIMTKERENEADFYVVIGGDGTLLPAFKKFARVDIPVIAINAGHLGFLTEIKKEDMFQEYQNFLEGKSQTQKRHFLKVKIGGKTYRALNEVVITRESVVKNMVKLKVFSEDSFVNHYKGDGLIIATPTGSTAYSLSAGGPIVGVPMKVYILTPIAPHNLNTRPLVMDGSSPLSVSLIEEEKAYCIIDGNNEKLLDGNDRVEISYSEETLHLVVPKNRDYYSVIREKLKWGDNLC